MRGLSVVFACSFRGVRLHRECECGAAAHRGLSWTVGGVQQESPECARQVNPPAHPAHPAIKPPPDLPPHIYCSRKWPLPTSGCACCFAFFSSSSFFSLLRVQTRGVSSAQWLSSLPAFFLLFFPLLCFFLSCSRSAALLLLLRFRVHCTLLPCCRNRASPPPSPRDPLASCSL